MTADPAEAARRLAARERVLVFGAPTQKFGQLLRSVGVANLGQGVSRRGAQFRALIFEKWDQRRGDLGLRVPRQRIDDRLEHSHLSLFSERGEQRRSRLIALAGAKISGADFQRPGRKSANDRRRIPLKSVAYRCDNWRFNRNRLVSQERADSD